jgi:hypothetical protein
MFTRTRSCLLFVACRAMCNVRQADPRHQKLQAERQVKDPAQLQAAKGPHTAGSGQHQHGQTATCSTTAAVRTAGRSCERSWQHAHHKLALAYLELQLQVLHRRIIIPLAYQAATAAETAAATAQGQHRSSRCEAQHPASC